jgi:hypothetical protein
LHPALVISLLLLCTFALIILLVSIAIKQSGQARLLEPASKQSHAGAHQLADLHRPWATHFRFEWIGGYQFRGLDRRFIAAWRHAEQPVFLLVEQVKGATHYELLSAFNRDQILSTTSMNAVVPPTPPKVFLQRFPDKPLTELFREHVAAHDFLLANGHVQLLPHPVRVDRVVIDMLARTHATVTALPFWPLRTLGWALIGPYKAANRSVPEQLAFAGVTSPVAPAPANDDPKGSTDDEMEADAEAS